MTENGGQLQDVPSHEEPGEEMAALIRSALTSDNVRAATRARLLARARPQLRAVSSPRMPLNIGLGLALAASITFLIIGQRERNELKETFAKAEVGRLARIDSLRTALSERDKFVAALTGPTVSVVGLSSAAAKSPRALMFWEKAADRWTFIAHNLPQLKAGRTYELWLITDKQKIPAGTFTVSAGGDALVQAVYALDHNALKAVAVTEEPAGGVQVPTGAIVVVGTAGTQ